MIISNFEKPSSSIKNYLRITDKGIDSLNLWGPGLGLGAFWIILSLEKKNLEITQIPAVLESIQL